jgi:hypothetical protein
MTPLNQVIPFVGLLAENLKHEGEENFQMVKMIENGMQKLKHLIDCIIEISSLQMGIFNM